MSQDESEENPEKQMETRVKVFGSGYNLKLLQILA